MKQKLLQGKKANDEARLLSHTDQGYPVVFKYSLEFLCLLGFSCWKDETALCKFAMGKDSFH